MHLSHGMGSRNHEACGSGLVLSKCPVLQVRIEGLGFDFRIRRETKQSCRAPPLKTSRWGLDSTIPRNSSPAGRSRRSSQ